jgi:hypothetical protein
MCPDTHFRVGDGEGDPAVIVLEVSGTNVQDICRYILFFEMCYWVVALKYVTVTPVLVSKGHFRESEQFLVLISDQSS